MSPRSGFEQKVGLGLYLDPDQFEKINGDDALAKFFIENSRLIFSIGETAFQVSQASSNDLIKRDAPVLKVTEATHPIAKPIGLNIEILESEVVQIICEKTGYPEDMIEREVDLESDLGVDTVKKMEIMADIADKYRLHFDKNFNIAKVSTVKSIVQLIQDDSRSEG